MPFQSPSMPLTLVWHFAEGVLATSNRRGGDAAAVLDSVNFALAAASTATPKAQGHILAKSPEYLPARAAASKSPKAMLQPADLAIFQRWGVILKIVLGKGTGAPKQISVILVISHPSDYRFQPCIGKLALKVDTEMHAYCLFILRIGMWQYLLA